MSAHAELARRGSPRNLTVRWRGFSAASPLRGAVVVCLLLVVLVPVLVVSVGTGEYSIPPADVVRALLGEGTPQTAFIVETLRLPRALDALLVGSALGVAGAIFQSVTRNPLGSPDVIGFTQGAAAGAVLELVVFGGGTLAVAGGAVAGGIGTAVLVYLLAYRNGLQGYRLILVGIGFSAMLAALTAYLIVRADLAAAQGAQIWLVGSLNGRGWEHVTPVAVALAALLPCALALSPALRTLELGDEAAASLGVARERTRLLAVAVGVGLTAVAIASVGPVAFVALASPQLARRLTRADGPGMVGAAAMGALVLALSDLLAQRLFPATPLPVGIFTGVLGGAYLIWLLATELRGAGQ